MAGFPFVRLNDSPFFLYLVIRRGYLGCFHVLAIVNHDAVNTGIHIFLQNNDFISFEHIPRSEIVESCGSFIFNS